MSNGASTTTRSKAVDVTATLGVLVVGAWVLAMTAPLVSALAVVLTAGLYIPMRRRAVPDKRLRG